MTRAAWKPLGASFPWKDTTDRPAVNLGRCEDPARGIMEWTGADGVHRIEEAALAEEDDAPKKAATLQVPKDLNVIP